MSIPTFAEHPELVVWRQGPCRCELWIVNGTPRLRLFRGDVVTRDFGVGSARQALELGAVWKGLTIGQPASQD